MNNGFFTRKNPNTPITPRTRTIKASSNIFANQTGPDCNRCGLYKLVKSPRMLPHGNGEMGIAIIGQAPGFHEDEEGITFSPNGESGRLLRNILNHHGIDLDKDCWRFNCVNCRTTNSEGKNRPPVASEINACRPLVNKYLRELKPRHIWLFGTEAVQSMFSNRFEKANITLMRGMTIPHKETGAWITSIYHPSFVLRKENDDHLWMVFNRDIEKAVSMLDHPAPTFDDYDKRVQCLTKFDEVMDVLLYIEQNKPITVIDYETTGIKPYKPFHTILSASICFNEEIAYSFPVDHCHWDLGDLMLLKDHLKYILQDPEIDLVAQNLSFENIWSREILHCEPASWIWDTMLVTHMLDDRHGITSLKFQAGARWGIDDYSREIKPYMVNTGEDGLNMLKQFPKDKLLHYGGLDALFEYWLYQDQLEEMSKPENSGLLEVYYNVMHGGIQTLCRMHSRGIAMDEQYYIAQFDQNFLEITKLENEIMNSEEAKLFEEHTGFALKQPDQKDFSAQNLCKLFFDILGHPTIKSTDKGNDSADAEVLEKLDMPFAKKIVQFRKHNKLKGYLEQFLRETYNGRMHPFFLLHTARSFRSSSSDPNFQNIPVRDADAKRITRSGIVSDPGAHILEADYSSLEVRIIACRSECPTLVAYILDPTTDMHRDQAMQLFLLPEEEVSKMIRFHTKNGWVFPEFYTSYFRSCARHIWPIVPTLETVSGVNLLTHLKSKGIRNYDQFETHLKKCENSFWQTFSAVKTWQDRVCNNYLTKGYVEMAFGHRRGGYLDRGKVINSDIQGPGFHCLLRSITVIDEIALDEGWTSYQFGQIHDSAMTMVFPEEWDRVLQVQEWVMTELIREEQPWIIVPLEIERGCSPLNASWFDQQEVNGEGVIQKGNWKDLCIVGQSIEDLNNQVEEDS